MIPAATQEIKNLEGKIQYLPFQMELCYESNQKAEKKSDTLNTADIQICALWKTRRSTPLCRLAITNCRFSEWLDNVMPFNYNRY